METPIDTKKEAGTHGIIADPVKKKSFSVITFFVISLALVSLFSFLRFYVFKNYDIIIENECNPEVEICFERDCDSEEGCPPNNLSIYKKYVIKAFQFDKCIDKDSCKHFCESPRNCVEIKCDTTEGDVCSN